MTPEERAMSLLYEDYVPEASPIISDEVLQLVNRIGSYTDRMLKHDSATLDDPTNEHLRNIARSAGELYHLWLKKPPLMSINAQQRKLLFELFCKPVNHIIGLSTLILADNESLLTGTQQFNVRIINEMAYSLLKQLQEVFI